MAEYVLPLLYALFVWWFSTGVILLLDGLPAATRRWTMSGATVVAAASLWGLALLRDDTSVAGAYLAFTAGVLVWGWQEIGFLTGLITGPRKHACPPGCTGWPHFRHAIEAILWHELAILATAAAVIAVAWGGANQVGTWTFLVLWAMRESAKLNLHFGVPNLSEEFLPAHLRYMTSFFARRPMNLLFPVSVTVATVVLVLLVRLMIADATGATVTAGLALVASLLALAILEHWFLVLPLPTSALWKWSLRASRRPSGRPSQNAPGSRQDSQPLVP